MVKPARIHHPAVINLAVINLAVINLVVISRRLQRGTALDRRLSLGLGSRSQAPEILRWPHSAQANRRRMPQRVQMPARAQVRQRCL
jgi:hypothetical protein